MELIQLSRPSVGEEEIEAAARVLRSGWLVQGPEGQAFEEELAAFCGKRYAAVLSSGTAALHLALCVMCPPPPAGAPPELPLLVPAFTFPATANVAAFLSRPVRVWLADVEEESFCVPSRCVSAFIERHRGPAMVVHQFGYPAPPPAPHLMALTLSDAACALGAKGALYGRAACLSFHPRKLLTTSEGGAVLSDDEGLIREVRALRSHGLVQVAGREVMGEPRPGLNYRLAEASSAIGRVQLRHLPRVIAAHEERAQRYRERLSGRLRMQADAPGRVWQTVAVVLPPGVERAATRRALRESGIETQIASYGLHRLAPFSAASVVGEGGAPATAGDLKVAEVLHERGLALPLHAGLSMAEIDHVCDVLLRLLDRTGTSKDPFG